MQHGCHAVSSTALGQDSFIVRGWYIATTRASAKRSRCNILLGSYRLGFGFNGGTTAFASRIAHASLDKTFASFDLGQTIHGCDDAKCFLLWLA